MKLRINGNSLRLRLTKSEVSKFSTDGVVKDQISFGKTALTYILEEIHSTEIVVSFEFNTVRVGVPIEIKEKWVIETEVGFETSIKFGDDELGVLVEKDFQCLIPRKEDEQDLFTNPLSESNGN